MPEAENVEIVRRMYDAFERGDLAAVVDLLDEDIDFKFQGPQEIPYTGAFLGRGNAKCVETNYAAPGVERAQKEALPNARK